MKAQAAAVVGKALHLPAIVPQVLNAADVRCQVRGQAEGWGSERNIIINVFRWQTPLYKVGLIGDSPSKNGTVRMKLAPALFILDFCLTRVDRSA